MAALAISMPHRHTKRVETLNYRAGGFHPVHLDDQFKNERYTVIHKLGHGGFATVWLARDSVRSRYVALKILAAHLSKDCPEVEILRRLQLGDGGGHIGKEYVMSMLDHFWIFGPNGDHLCVVSEVGGPSIKLWNESPGLRSGTRRLRAAVARKVSLQAVEGLAYIHSMGTVHGDFTSANILLQLANIDAWTVKEIHERLGEPQTQDLHRSPGGPADSPAPKYTVNAISMKEVDPQWLSDQIMIIDFGIAFLQEQSSRYIGTPKSHCAPEFLFEMPRSVSSDIWALGCSIFEIRTGSGLFRSNGVTPTRDNALKGMVKLLGSLPPSWWDKWNTGREWYMSEMKEGGDLEGRLSGNLYEQIMEIGKFDGDALAPRPNRKVSSTKEGSSSEKKPSSSSLITTNRLIAMVDEITTDEAEEVMAAVSEGQPDSGSSNENVSRYASSIKAIKGHSGSSNESKSNSSSSNKNKENSGSTSNPKSNDKSISSEGVITNKGSTGKGNSDSKSTAREKNLIGGDGKGLAGSVKDATASSQVVDFLEPAGTVISEIEAEGLENLLRKALSYLPEERLAPSELAKHHWFFDVFETKIMEPLAKEDIIDEDPNEEDDEDNEEEEENEEDVEGGVDLRGEDNLNKVDSLEDSKSGRGL